MAHVLQNMVYTVSAQFKNKSHVSVDNNDRKGQEESQDKIVMMFLEEKQ